MRAMKRLLLVTLLPALISACGSVEIQPGETEAFADMGYTYYRWHSVPVQDPDNGHVPGRAIDPTVRQAVDEALKAKTAELRQRHAVTAHGAFLVASFLGSLEPISQTKMMKDRTGIGRLFVEAFARPGAIKGVDLALGLFQQIRLKGPFVVATNGINDTPFSLKDVVIVQTTYFLAIVVKLTRRSLGIPTDLLHTRAIGHWCKGMKPSVTVLIHIITILCLGVVRGELIPPSRNSLLNHREGLTQ